MQEEKGGQRGHRSGENGRVEEGVQWSSGGDEGKEMWSENGKLKCNSILIR